MHTMSAMLPIAVLFSFVSCMNLVAIVWGLYLVVAASVGGSGASAKSSWIVFGLFSRSFRWCCLFSVQYAVRSMGSYPANLERMRGHMGRSGYDPGRSRMECVATGTLLTTSVRARRSSRLRQDGCNSEDSVNAQRHRTR
ncbi:MAG: hypothetical protein ACYDHY_13435 [Acidiferrobacterales bacterium]